MEDKKAEIEFSLKLIEQLPDDRKLFFDTGIISIEVTKEEAIQLLKEMLNEIEKQK